MNGVIYPEEQVISEFTLALLEDTGYYKANYYTGGLMRYGKGKGCDFIKKRCVNSSHEINPKFENEFFDSIASSYSRDSSCSSGRQSRTYNFFLPYKNLSEYYKYFDGEKENYGGFSPADYCPVPKEYYEENIDSYYTGHCSSKGNGGYGTQILYLKNEKIILNSTHYAIKYIYYHNKSEDLYSITGETYSDHSFCYQSELIKNNLNFSLGVRAICYESFCSNYSLTVKVNDDYIVCPRAGGKIEVEGYKGFLLCPDYNLICSGTVMCNDMFDCVDKKSEIKEETYFYDYQIKTSQNIEIAEISLSDDENNYELGENGICPINCKHCFQNNKCIECRNNFGLVGSKENEEVKCLPLYNLTLGYYQDNNIYYPCMENCDICMNNISCNNCSFGFELIEGICRPSKIIEYCLILVNNSYYQKYEKNYIFNVDNTTECLNKTIFENYYTMDDGITYFPCDKEITNCSQCYYDKNNAQVKCYLCNNDSFVLNNEGVCLNTEQINETYFYINETHINKCSNTMINCEQCENNNTCIKCKNDFYMVNDNTCVNISIFPEDEFFLNDDNRTYFCNNSIYHHIKNCKKCNGKYNCTLCQNNFTFIDGNKSICVEKEFLMNKYVQDPLDKSNFIKCENIFDINCDLCNNFQCLSCKEDYIFINDNYSQCELKSSINLSDYFTNDNITYYSCKEEKYKDREECQKNISYDMTEISSYQIHSYQIHSPDNIKNPSLELLILQVQIIQKKLVIFAIISKKIENLLSIKLKILLFRYNLTRNLQESQEIDLYINGNFEPGKLINLTSENEFEEKDRIQVKPQKNQDDSISISVSLLSEKIGDTKEVETMIKNKEITDFSIAQPNIYNIERISGECKFDLFLKESFNEQTEKKIILKFKEENNENNIIDVECLLTKDNLHKISCSLNKEVNGEYILSPQFPIENENFLINTIEGKTFHLSCQNENKKDEIKIEVIIIVVGVLFILIIITVIILIIYCNRKKVSKVSIKSKFYNEDSNSERGNNYRWKMKKNKYYFDN